jgi:hypothetical protein
MNDLNLMKVTSMEVVFYTMNENVSMARLAWKVVIILISTFWFS